MSVGAGDAITATGAGGSINCGGTTSTVDLIAVFGTDVGNETLIIDEGVGGRFEPGALRAGSLVVPNGINEIEWYVNLGEDIVDQADPASDTADVDCYDDNDTLVINDIQVAGAVRIGEGCLARLGLGQRSPPIPAAPGGVTAGGRRCQCSAATWST